MSAAELVHVLIIVVVAVMSFAAGYVLGCSDEAGRALRRRSGKGADHVE